MTVSRFKDKTPLKSLAKASQSCAAQSVAYGKCVGQSYQEVSKGMCDAEFRAFKECVQDARGAELIKQKAFGRKW